MSARKTRKTTQDLGSKAWGKLISKTSGAPDFQLVDDQTTIGRKATNNLVINDGALSGSHCVIYKKGDKILLRDLSSNGTYLNNTKIGNGNEVDLQDGNQIWLLHSSRISTDKTIGYLFQWTEKKTKQQDKKAQDSASKQELKKKVQQMAQEQEQRKKKTQQQMQKLAEEKKKTQAQKDDLQKVLKDQITCSVCLQIMHVPVAVHPCNHHFCGGCLTSLVNSKQQNCIQCRKQITTAQRDANFNVIIQQYLKTHPQEKRSADEIADLDKNNVFTFDTVNVQQLIHGKKVDPPASRATRAVRGRPARGRPLARRNSDLSASDSSDDDDSHCRQCNITRNGFQCAAGQAHVNCHSCGKLLAQRNDPTLHQSCVLCEQFFCNLYYPPCSSTGVKLGTVDSYGIKAKVGIQNFRGNKFQFDYFNDFVRTKSYNPRQLFDVIATKYLDSNLFRFIYDRKVMRVPPVASRQVAITRDSSVCTTCWSDLWFQLILRYRIDINSELPSAVSSRVPCYYGVNCSTMGHKPDHAKKLNHCGYQTKF